ncbi:MULTISPECIES: hypothetical protein [unclassified Sphingomonas]|jgi:hypothetical protein|uniref:hypothetical protein n=1 Tax=unclassified Sphingomonas TaxID=196159 RepID=UPI0028664F2C|nr:hypothetical protein [Sphingomonas sp. BE123]MDR6851729.1 hypothetical protein [Sphingomonas sp. BE123]
MKNLKLLGATLALLASPVAHAAEGMDCCKDMKTCCCKKEGDKPGCCDDMKKGTPSTQGK